MQSISGTVSGRCLSGLGLKYTLVRSQLMSTSHVRQAQKAVRGKAVQQKPLQYIPAVRKAPPTPPPSSSKTLPFASRKLPLMLAGITVLLASSYGTYLFVGYKRAIAEGLKETIPEDVSQRYDAIAPSFDSSVDWTESLMGLNRLRKKMAQEASGDVCEVSIGTGRNLSFYDWNFPGFNGVGKPGKGHVIKRGKVKSFTAIDKSAEMLEIAHDKFAKEYPGIIGVRWVIQDAAKPLPRLPVSASERTGTVPAKKYDTIIQTMGLCSTTDPVGLLKNLGESVEDGGRILLLEHGRSTWDWMNNILDGLAARHAREFGCVWNKDIGEIVKESGLEVVKMERKHAGTTWWIELRPKKAAATDETETLKAPQNKSKESQVGYGPPDKPQDRDKKETKAKSSGPHRRVNSLADNGQERSTG